jgi:hypothetical protein
MAALRIKGVVSPQHAPTIRKPNIHRKKDGCGSDLMGVPVSIIARKTVLYVAL